MDTSQEKRTDSPWCVVMGLLALFGLLSWQAYLTLSLFGPVYPWNNLWNDQPLLSGSHPQHLYLGSLGAQGLLANGNISSFDPKFQAGYPRTPIFIGSKQAEIFLLLGGGEYNPAAYKIGLALISLLIPIAIVLASRGAGMSRSGAFFSSLLGMLVWWGPLGQTPLETGQLDILLASLGVLTHVGMMIRFDREPGLLSWTGLIASAWIGWFYQPLLFPIAMPMLLIFYLTVGDKHPTWTWHLSFFGAQGLAVGLNYPWLFDWVSFWWLRAPLPSPRDLLAHRTVETLWNAPIWGGTMERALGVFILASGLVGNILFQRTRQFSCVRLFGLGSVCMMVLAFLGISWEPLGEMGTSGLLAPALLFSVVPAGHAWSKILLEKGKTKSGRVIGFVALTLIGVGFYFVPKESMAIYERLFPGQPLQIGLGSDREAMVEKIMQYTGTEGRILWEDRQLPRKDPRWSALLPILTGRTYLGGLDPDATIEHSLISFVNQSLEGRPISTWTDKELSEYCHRYNLGWVVCWTPETIKRFSEWEGAEKSVPLQDDVPGYLFTLKRGPFSYALKGKANLLHGDDHHITLGDVEPDQGVVVLSLHYQKGMRAFPSRVQVEREPSGQDAIGFIRLRMVGPAARVTLTWGY